MRTLTPEEEAKLAEIALTAPHSAALLRGQFERIGTAEQAADLLRCLDLVTCDDSTLHEPLMGPTEADRARIVAMMKGETKM